MSVETKVRARCVTSKTAYQLLRGERLVGLAIALANGTWMVCGVDNENPVTPERFLSPRDAAEWAQRMGMGL